MRETLEQRFYRFVERIPESGCHIWTGALFVGRGYGAFRVGEKQRRAHRVSWELHYGSIPEGQQVLHKCDVRSCVNPAHLFLGSQLDNMRDMICKGRKRSSAGERNGHSKLTAAQVADIVSASGKLQRVVAAEYGISQTAVSMIRLGKRWAGCSRCEA